MPTVLNGVSTEETYNLKWVVDIAAPATGPSLATEYNAATSIALECLTQDRINVTPSVETASLKRACSSKVRQVSGAETRTLDDVIIVFDPQDLAAPVSAPYVALAKGAEGFLVMRAGVDVDTAATAGDLVHIYHVRVKYRAVVQPVDNDEWKARVGFDVIDWWEDVALAA